MTEIATPDLKQPARPTDAEEALGTHQKALSLNIDNAKYGTFAEIGAGQEVVRWFFHAGGAAGTVAKSMSAYDMAVSDDIYGACERYVSKERLCSMLDHEYELLLGRLDEERGDNATFFAFANTVAAISYKRRGDGHGWMGIRFQTTPRAEPSEIDVHVRLLDSENLSQQEALGIVGVNLIYGAFHYHDDPDHLIASLLDDLTTARIEIDLIQLSGPAFADVDHRLMSLKLVEHGLSEAAMFSADGEVLQPADALYKRPILLERGRFRPLTHTHLDILQGARQQFATQDGVDEDQLVVLMELTMSSLKEEGEVDYADFLARADMLASTGAAVLVSNYFEFYRLANYLSRYTNQPIGIAMGMPSLQRVFDEQYYEDLSGGILESFGRLFRTQTKLYVYPVKDRENGKLLSVPKLKVAPHLQHLYEHLVENGYIESIDFYDRDCLDIFPDDVRAKLTSGDPSWEEMVPEAVARTIKEEGYFGYQKEG